MHGGTRSSLGVSGWRTLYRAAIAETEKCAVPAKVTHAERAILARERELFYNSGTLEEKEELQQALCLLRVFKAVCQHRIAA